MLAQFKSHIAHCFPELNKAAFLVACSGGMDSVVLAHLCDQSGLDFGLAHCNFKLRGGESDGDAQFVKGLAEKMGKTYYGTSFNTLAHAQRHRESVQVAARNLRYGWFNELMKDHQISFLVTAHHADDNLETFLINLSRGGGIKGLMGIPAKNGPICRPLLPFSHQELQTYAQEKGLDWREDSSNTDRKYLRNKIRHDLVPALKTLHPTFLANFKKTQNHLKQFYGLSEHYLETLKKELFIKQQDRYKIPISVLKELKPLNAHLYGLLHPYAFTEWDNVRDLLEGASGKIIYSNTHMLLKDRKHLWLRPITGMGATSDYYLLAEGEDAVDHPVRLRLEPVKTMDRHGKDIIYVDGNTLAYPLELRKWKQGDYFYPFGLNGKKKMAKFFKDEKLDVFSKQEQWLLCSEGAVVWVIGRRMDDRFKVVPKTKNIIRISHLPCEK